MLKSLRVGMGGTLASLGSWHQGVRPVHELFVWPGEKQVFFLVCHTGFMRHAAVACTLGSGSELRRGLDAERVMPRTEAGGLLGSGPESASPAVPRVTELPAFLRDVLQETGASVVVGLLGSCYTASKKSPPLLFNRITQLKTDIWCCLGNFLFMWPFSLGLQRCSLTWR